MIMNENTDLLKAKLTPDVISFLETGNVAMTPDGTAYYLTLNGVYIKKGENWFLSLNLHSLPDFVRSAYVDVLTDSMKKAALNKKL